MSASAWLAAALADSPGGAWPLNDASGNPQDYSGNGNHVTAIGGTPDYQIDGGEGVHFTRASSEKFTVPDANSLDMGDVWTIEGWVRNPAATSTDKGIISKQAGAGYVRIGPGDNGGPKNNLPLSLNSGVIGLQGTATPLIWDTTTWRQVVATKNTTTLHFYIDGAINDGAVLATTASVNNTSALTIGADGGSDFADMDMKYIAYYPTALSAGRVLAHYNAGLIRTITPGGIASAEAFGVARITRLLLGAGIGTQETFGTTRARRNLAATGVATLEAFGATDRITRILAAAGVATGETFGADRILRGIRNAGAIASAEAAGAPAARRIILPAGVASAATVGTPATVRYVRAFNITTGETFGVTVVGSIVPPGPQSAPGEVLLGDQPAFSVLVSDSETWVVTISDHLV